MTQDGPENPAGLTDLTAPASREDPVEPAVPADAATILVTAIDRAEDRRSAAGKARRRTDRLV